jgi:hypothetical protein
MVDRGIDEPTLWINPYLVQALEAAREVHNGEHRITITSMQWVQGSDIPALDHHHDTA